MERIVLKKIDDTSVYCCPNEVGNVVCDEMLKACPFERKVVNELDVHFTCQNDASQSYYTEKREQQETR